VNKKLSEKDEISAAKKLANILEKRMNNDSMLNTFRKKLITTLREKKPKDFKSWKPNK
jgi:hypothetical protein